MRNVLKLVGLVVSLSFIMLSPTISKALSVFPKSPEDAERKLASSLLKGTQNVLIVLVKTPNKPLIDQHLPYPEDWRKSEYEKSIATGLDSYYREVSYGKFGLSVKVIDWVDVPDDISDKHKRANKALDLVFSNTNIKPGDYDKDGNKEFDFILIFDTKAPRGDSEATSMKLEGVKPAETEISGTGKKLDWYVYMRPSRELALVAHEFGHLLGLLDMYSSVFVKGTIGDIGRWGLMSGAEIHGTPYSHLCAYSKVKLGWATPIELDQSGNRIIKAAEIKDYGSIYRISTSKPNEYFLLEYRQRSGYDQDLPGEGILIWHIDLNVG
ncbi:MAG: M6 family metalloprotease domain-containing protein [bacterium]